MESAETQPQPERQPSGKSRNAGGRVAGAALAKGGIHDQPHAHGVQFYDDDRFLAGIAGDSLAAALRDGRPAVVIATAAHRELIAQRLRSAGVDVDLARESGQLTMLDAVKTLERFMHGSTPSPTRFASVIGGLLQAAGASRPGVCIAAYGEMVDLLWAARNSSAALRLEQLWNDLARTHDYSLLCAYRMSHFARADDAELFQAICAEHTHVSPAESYAPTDEDHRLREITKLQQRARALESEIQERTRLEQALRSTVRSVQASEAQERAARADAERARLEAHKARLAAEQANRAKSDFLAMMGHELRTPLNAIGGYAELIELGVHGPVTPAQREALQRIQRSQVLLLGIVNQVLNYARLETGNIEFSVGDVPVDAVIRVAEALLAPQFHAKSLRFEYACATPGVRIMADEEKVQQILLNLLTNAFKFTQTGGTVRVRLEASDEQVAISVEDTGIGIAPDKLESIFDPFVQVDANYTRAQEGVGLGLAISRDLARRMGGELTATSVLGRGSRFTLTFPREGSRGD